MNNNKKKRFFEKYPRLSLLIIVLIGFLAIDFIAGLFFIPENNNEFRTFHPYYHHGLHSNVSARTTWDAENYYSFYTNSLGFRDDTIKNVPLETQKTRVLIIGDSHTEGVGLEFEDTFTGLLRKSTNSGQYEFLNAGVVSYSPKLYYLKTKFLLEETKLKFDHLMVFIDISDIQNELAYEDFNPGENKHFAMQLHQSDRFLKDYSLAWYSIQQFRDNRQLQAFYKNANRNVKNPKTDTYSSFFTDFDNTEFLRDKAFHDIGLWYLDKDTFEKWGRKGLVLESEYMQKLVELCNKYNIRLTISIHPWPIQIQYGDINSIQVQFWSKFAQEYKIGLINHFPIFLTLNQQVNVINECYQKGDVHWNEQGNEVATETILDYLETVYPDIRE